MLMCTWSRNHVNCGRMTPTVKLTDSFSKAIPNSTGSFIQAFKNFIEWYAIWNSIYKQLQMWKKGLAMANYHHLKFPWLSLWTKYQMNTPNNKISCFRKIKICWKGTQNYMHVQAPWYETAFLKQHCLNFWDGNTACCLVAHAEHCLDFTEYRHELLCLPRNCKQNCKTALSVNSSDLKMEGRSLIKQQSWLDLWHCPKLFLLWRPEIMTDYSNSDKHLPLIEVWLKPLVCFPWCSVSSWSQTQSSVAQC